MSTSPTPTTPAQDEGAVANAARHWSLDDIVVVLFALLGVAGGAMLPLFRPVAPIIVSFLLATGLAALTYRFLGGIGEASFVLGALKVTGTLGALVGVAVLINHEMMTEQHQTYHVTGNVVDNTGNAVNGLDVGAFTLWPPAVLSDPKGNTFSIWFTTESTYYPQPAMLTVTNGSLSTSIDLSKAQRNGFEIPLGIVQLKEQNSSSSARTPTLSSYAGETASLSGEPEKKP